MKIWAGRALLLVGAFLLIAGAIAAFWAGGAAKRTPLDTDSWTRLTGEASGAYVDASDMDKVEPVQYWVHTTVDAKASTGDVVVFSKASCMMVDEGTLPTTTCVDFKDDRLINQNDPDAPEIFATDRRTGEAVADQGTYYPYATVAYKGLINKFPFDTEKKDYDYWDGYLNTTVKAQFIEETQIDGLDVYKFEVAIPETETTVGENDITYEAAQTLWVEPHTGSFVDQTGAQTMILVNEDGTAGPVVLDVNVRYTAETVATNVEDSKANVKMLNMISVVLPIVGFVGGALLILVGLLLASRGKKDIKKA